MIMKLFSCYNRVNQLEITLNCDMEDTEVYIKLKGGAPYENER